MLTPTEVHLLAGMLVLASAESGEDVELGSKLTDQASGTQRDIDITIRCRIDGVPHVLAGLEVKAHGRPLDIEDVEQLVIKLSDVAVPSGRRAIVSASGYTAAAKAKARSHQVELYSLIPWCDALAAYDTPFRGHHPMLLTEIFWSEGPRVHVEVEAGGAPAQMDDVKTEVLIEERDGTLTRRPLSVITNNCAQEASARADQNWTPLKSPGQNSRPVDHRIDPQNRVFLLDRGQQFPVAWVSVSGIRTLEAVDGKESLRFLVNAETLKPIVSCSVRVLRGGQLTVLAWDHRSQRLAIHTITAEIRAKKKIYRLLMESSNCNWTSRLSVENGGFVSKHETKGLRHS